MSWQEAPRLRFAWCVAANTLVLLLVAVLLIFGVGRDAPLWTALIGVPPGLAWGVLICHTTDVYETIQKDS